MSAPTPTRANPDPVAMLRHMSDDALDAEVHEALAQMSGCRVMLADSLRLLSQQALTDAESVGSMPPEAVRYTYGGAVDAVRRNRDELEAARERLHAAGTERNRRDKIVP